MFITKYIKIEFANPNIKAIDTLQDILQAIKHAAINLKSRYDVTIEKVRVYSEDNVIIEMSIPTSICENYSIGRHLKGISNYLLKQCNGKYDEYVVGKRLLFYTEVPTPTISIGNTEMDKFEIAQRFINLSKIISEVVMMTNREQAIITAYTSIKLQDDYRYLLDYLSSITGRAVTKSEMNDVIFANKNRIERDYRRMSLRYNDVFMGGKRG